MLRAPRVPLLAESERERAADYLELANRKAWHSTRMEEALDYFYEALAILRRPTRLRYNGRRRLTLVLDQAGGIHYLHRHVDYYELLLRHEPLALEQSDSGLFGASRRASAHRRWPSANTSRAERPRTKHSELCVRAGDHENAARACNHVQMGAHAARRVRARPPLRGAGAQHLAASFDPIAYMYAQAGAALTHMMVGRWGGAARGRRSCGDRHGAFRRWHGLVLQRDRTLVLRRETG